jgi:hypothetical protein
MCVCVCVCVHVCMCVCVCVCVCMLAHVVKSWPRNNMYKEMHTWQPKVPPAVHRLCVRVCVRARARCVTTEASEKEGRCEDRDGQTHETWMRREGEREGGREREREERKRARERESTADLLNIKVSYNRGDCEAEDGALPCNSHRCRRRCCTPRSARRYVMKYVSVAKHVRI